MAYKQIQIRGNAKIGQPKGARVKSYGLRERAWWLMRRLGTFTVDTLLNTIALGTEKAAYKSLRKYLNALARAHIVKAEPTPPKPGDGGNGAYRYQLVRDLGMQPPVWRQKVDEIYDPNSKTVIPCDAKTRSKVVNEEEQDA